VQAFADHFSSIAAQYAAYRPRYPRALVDALVARCMRWDVAWDAGCGSGQLSVALASAFERVLATDPAQAQLDAATVHPRVEYRRASAETSGLPDASIDLAVAAQAAHWFEWPRYVAEVGRVARPGALAAIVSYGIIRVTHDAGAIVDKYYRDLDAYWPPEREHVENGYRDLAWPWPAVDAPAVDMIERWTRDQLVGYVASWSATARLVAKEGPARFDALRERLAEVWPDDEPRAISWPLTIKLARVER
jgi:SAM-dependent methyltransferase